MVRTLYGLQSLFSLWMIVDAARRGAARYWYPIIFLPGGPLAYFFMVKIHDHQFRGIRQFFDALLKPKVTLEKLRFVAAETPSFANKLALAQALFDADLFQEAAGYFEAVLRLDEDSKDALYGYALCQLELENFEHAIAPLQRLIEIKPSFHDYEPWTRLAHSLSKTEQPLDALAVLADLVKKAPRLSHRVTYAGYLWKEQQYDKAREQLELGLASHEHDPRFQRRQDSAIAKKARAMLSRLDAG